MSNTSGVPYDVLRDHLKGLRRRAGNPSYRELQRPWRGALADRGKVVIFAASTIADNLNGNRRSMSWDFVRFMVASCWVHAGDGALHAEEASGGLTAQDLDPGFWRGLWMAQNEPSEPEPRRAACTSVQRPNGAGQRRMAGTGPRGTGSAGADRGVVRGVQITTPQACMTASATVTMGKAA